MIDDRFLPRVWTDEGYYYPIFSELGITYENKNLPFTEENIKDINWAFRWRFNHSNENVDMEYINTLEQCTGLRDKNGKLIYEGDIVEIMVWDDIEEDWIETKGKVYWSKEDAAFLIFVSYDGEYSLNSQETFYGQEIKVIGNIHENADLLENEE